MKAPIRISRPRGLKVPRPRGWQDWALAAACLVVIVIAVTAVGSSAAGSTSSSTRTAEVGRGVVQATVSGNGSLEPAKQVELSFGASGEVTAIYVKAGEEVAKGQILARVDASSARASLAAARAQLSEAEETLEAAEEAESESEEVAYRGADEATTALVDYVADTTTPETTSGEGESESAAEDEGEDEGSEEGEEEQQGGSKESSSKEQSGSQQKSGGSTGNGSKEEAKSESESGEPAAAAEGSSGGGSEEGAAAGGGATVSVATAEAQVKEARLSVRSAEREVRETTLRAPFHGTVATVSGSVGETVSGGESSSGSGGASPNGESSSGSSFIVLSQISKLKMEIAFSEADIGKVEVGQIATVSVSSMEGTELAGRVTKVDVLPSEGSTGVVEYPATILLTQNAEGVRAGMSASAEVVVEQVSNAVTVPSEAINSGPTKTVTVSEDGKEVTKTVKTGLVGDETTEIVSGLKAGETVILPEATVTAASGSGGEKSESSSGFPGGGFSAGGGLPGGAGGGPPGFGGG